VLEKAKQALETEKVNLTTELEQAATARQDLERRRKQSEQQVQELTSRLAETDRAKTDFSNKAAKLQVSVAKNSKLLYQMLRLLPIQI